MLNLDDIGLRIPDPGDVIAYKTKGSDFTENGNLTLVIWVKGHDEPLRHVDTISNIEAAVDQLDDYYGDGADGDGADPEVLTE